MTKTTAVFLVLLAACRTLPEGEQRVALAYPPAEEGPIADAAKAFAARAGKDANGFLPAPNGRLALEWRVGLIDTARVSVDAQYFVWHRDAVGMLLIEHLIAAAKRGVRVRLIVDDYTLEDQDRGITLLSREKNIEIRVFNPSDTRGDRPGAKLAEGAFSLHRMNQRMHNKQFLVDNRVAVIGGRNIADEYFGLNKKYNFIDMDLVVVGPAVQELSRRFDEYWNSEIVYPGGSLMEGLDEQDDEEVWKAARALIAKHEPRTRAFKRPPEDWIKRLEGLPKKLEPGKAEVLFDHADTEDPSQVSRKLDQPGAEAKKEVMVVMAYVLPDKYFLEWFREMTARGVRVRVLTNSLATYDSSAGANFYANGRRSVLETGVELYELRPDAEDRVLARTGTLAGDSVALHAKVVVFDRKRVFVGSFNFEPRAHRYNREDGLLVDAPALAERFHHGAERLMQPRNCWAVTIDKEGELLWTSHDGATSESPQGAFAIRSVLFGLVPEKFR